jgi:predicted Zn-dependent protease
MRYSIVLSTMMMIFQCNVFAENKVLLNAMKDELARSIGQLKLEGEAGPYYISYIAEDVLEATIQAESGAITSSSENRSRWLNVDLRVGDYSLDNSNFVSGAGIARIIGNTANIRLPLPLDDDYFGFRRNMWLATDTAYKTAVDTLSRKKSFIQNSSKTEDLPDFSKGGSTSRIAVENKLAINKELWNQRVDQIAKLLTGRKEIQESRVTLIVRIMNLYYANSEGAIAIEPQSGAEMIISATTQAEDGMPIGHYLSYTAALPEGFPEKTKIESDIKNLISELSAFRNAPLAEPYSGPVLFVGQAAGEFFNQGVLRFFNANRLPKSDNPLISRNQENPFLDKVNAKVAPGFISIKAIPTMKNYGGQALLGACETDDEGVPCQDVSLVENGILKNLLTTRTPVKGFLQSNGHARRGAPAPSVILITSTNKKTYEELKQDLINAAKEEGLPYGYIVRGLTSTIEMLTSSSDLLQTLISRQGTSESTQFKLINPYAVFRVYPDGKEEPVRGIEFASININTLRNIQATSNDEIVHNFNVGLTSHPSTIIAPSFLIGGIDLKKFLGIGTYPKPPIVNPPNFEGEK